jgi:hypothetical protein
MGDITSHKLIIAKGFLFLLAGGLAAAALLLEHPELRTAVLLVVAIWYFAFYVLEHYVDPAYRFAGLGSFATYFWRRWMEKRRQTGK